MLVTVTSGRGGSAGGEADAETGGTGALAEGGATGAGALETTGGAGASAALVVAETDAGGDASVRTGAGVAGEQDAISRHVKSRGRDIRRV